MCLFQIYSGLTKWDVINKADLKRPRNGNFQIVVPLLYAHYHIYFSFYHANSIAIIQEKVRIYKYVFDTFVNSDFASLSSRGMVIQQFIKLGNPLQVANFGRFFVTHSQPY